MPEPTINPFNGQLVFSAFSPMLPDAPVVPDGEEVYNRIMGRINPDLTTQILPTLAKKYAGETEQQHGARQEQYKKDLVAYKKEAAAYISDLQSQVTNFERTTRQMAELTDTHEENGKLNSISNAINHS